MNSAILLKATTGNDNGNDDYLRDTTGPYRGERRSAAGIALWVFMGVATALFALFLTAYVMRMDSTDWSPIAMPPQLWLSTALLVTGSILMHLAGTRAGSASWHRAYVLFIAGGVCAIAFICVQLWAWQQLLTDRVSMAGNPAASFFYLLTAMHGLHVAGGQIAWAASVRGVWSGAGGIHAATRIKLCARYWHFLLAVWLVLFGTLGWLTPEAVRLICGTR
ncbi:bb3-type cytochrome oxidase subunit III [Noviherbaspirillum sp. Root189]|uniref:bb3-type cytochrome oxidase subunit III n=1 Tax=Noviherbaspirillum sp. Root189 TaxID=1736487 RepID=UPI0007108A4A|nr:bb3-type cytochrome oxidase subunit III [Noviherbaspirillum sp. Root189]KRB83885.1 bb3-type cytochrome oxidase subunit III [Noviherbaspirillum sp. Root189]